MSAPRRSAGRDRAEGFTLIEVLVAFAITAIILVPLLRLFSLGIGSFNNSQAYATASLWAESTLESYGVDEPIIEGVQAGALAGGIRWERRTALYTENAVSARRSGSVALLPYAVTLTISWPERLGRRSLTVHALRLAPPPAS